MAAEKRGKPEPVVGTYKPPEGERQHFSATMGFDRAMKAALDEAACQWPKPAEFHVRVHFEARVDVWNPGGIGAYAVILDPTGGDWPHG